MAGTAALDIVRAPAGRVNNAASEAPQTLISPAIPSQPFLKPQNQLSSEAGYLRFARSDRNPLMPDSTAAMLEIRCRLVHRQVFVKDPFFEEGSRRD